MKNKSIAGEMSVYACLIALTILIIFSPIVSYAQAKRESNYTKNAIAQMMEQYTSLLSIELYDDLKYRPTSGGAYEKLDESGYVEKLLPDAVFQSAGFTKDSEIYKNGGTIKISDYSAKMLKNNDAVVFVLSYKMQIPLRILGVQYYSYTHTYQAVARLS